MAAVADWGVDGWQWHHWTKVLWGGVLALPPPSSEAEVLMHDGNSVFMNTKCKIYHVFNQAINLVHRQKNTGLSWCQRTHTMSSIMPNCPLLFRYRLTQFVLEKRPLNGCSSRSKVSRQTNYLATLLRLKVPQMRTGVCIPCHSRQ